MPIIFDEPIDMYHASPYLSTSKLGDFASRGPRHFAQLHVNRVSPRLPETKAQVFGNAFECLVCETKAAFFSRYAVQPDGMKLTTKEGKAWAAGHTADGKQLLKHSEFETMERMVLSLTENETAMAMIRAARTQVTMRTAVDGIPGLQARPDWYGADGIACTGWSPYTLDLKTTISFGKIAAGRGVIEYKYHCQAAIVDACARANGLTVQTFLLVIEKCAPYRCQVMSFDTQWLDYGWQWCHTQISKLREHYASGDWPRVPSEMAALPPPPAWAAKIDDVADETEDEEDEE